MNNNDQMTLGATLLLTPAWVLVLQDVNLILSVIAAGCGAIVGIVAVTHLVLRRIGRHRRGL